MMNYCVLWTQQCVSGTSCKMFQQGKNCRFTGIKAIRSQSVALAFWKLNLATIHEHGEWHIHFQCILGLREGRDLLMAKSSPVKWHKCLGCHIVMDDTL